VRHGRALVAIGAAQLVVSVALLLIASTTPQRLPRWGGPVDGAIAFTLVATLGVLYQATASRVRMAELRPSYHVATLLPAAVLVLLWLFRGRLIWNVLLPGLAWRIFVVLSAVPLAMAAVRRTEGDDS